MRISASIASMMIAMMPVAVSAGPVKSTNAKSAEEIVRFFASTIDLGANRGICVGTEEECKSKKLEPSQTGLDMLVNFDLDSAELTADARSKLEQFAAALKDTRLSSHNFVVEGYTDASGPESYNMGLSERRAQSVSAFLLSQGVAASRINAIGFGEQRPRVDDPFDPVNRRVEMRIKLQ